jgi:hypothetical protein
MALGTVLLVLLLIVAIPLAASTSECQHHSKVAKSQPPRGAPAVSEDWELLPPGQRCTYSWEDGATIGYNKTLPWLRSFTPGPLE